MIRPFKHGLSNFKWFWIPVLVFLIGPATGLAAGLSLSEAVDTALSENPGLQAAGFQTLSAQEKILQARSGAMPQVQLTGQYARTTNPMWAFGTRLNQAAITTMDFAPDRLNNPDDINNYGSVLSVNWALYDQGQTGYTLTLARLGKEAAQLFTERTRQQVISGTITAYMGALLARENQRVLHQVVETAAAHLKLVQSRYDGGFVAKSDLLRAQVHMADLEQQLADAQSQTDIAKCGLSIAMGMGGTLDQALVTPLEINSKPVTGSLEVWIEKALSSRPDLKQLVHQRQMAEKEVDKARALRHPSVNLTGNYEINTEDFNDSGTNYTLGAMVSLPLYTGGRTAAQIREAEINLKQTNALVRRLNQQICGETRQAFFTAQSAWERIRVTRAAVSQSEESLRIVRNRYHSGLFTIADLLDAETLVQQSLTRKLAAIHDYRTSITRLALAAGVIDRTYQP